MSLLFLFAVAGLIAAQAPKDSPKESSTKEPAYAGKSLSEWVKQLDSPDATERSKADDALRELASQLDTVAESLVTALAAPENKSRAQARALIALGPRAVPAVAAGLWSSDDRVKEVLLAVLARIGEDAHPAAPTLVKMLADRNAVIRTGAANALRAAGAYSSVPALTKLLADPDETVRLTAADSLAAFGADAAIVLPVFTELLEAKAAKLPDAAARGIALLGPEAAPAVPALIARLPKADLDETFTLIWALSRIGPGAKDAIPALKKKLADEKKAPELLQVQVAVALWSIARDPEAGKLLRAALENDISRDRAAVILRRSDLGEDTIAALEAMLKSDKPANVIVAASILGTKAKEAVPLLGKLAAHTEARVRAAAVVALMQLGPQAKEAIDALRGAAKDDDPQIAFWATVGVCRLDPKAETVAAVAGYLTARDPLLRHDAASVLGLLGDAAKSATSRLTAALEDTEESVRLAAAVALWKIEFNPTIVSTLTKMLGSNDPRIRELAVSEVGVTLGAEGKRVVSELVKRLFDPYSGVRSVAAETLGRIGPDAKGAAPTLLALLEGEEPAFVQSAACEALGLIEPADKEAVAAVLKKKLDHPDPLTRTHAALALVLVSGDKAGEKVAERGLGYRTYQVRLTAAEALWRMNKDARVVPLLVRTLEESNLEGTGSDNERYMAVRALGRIGAAGKPAVGELVKLLTHADQQLAAAAAQALKAIDPDAAKKAGVK
jgi:HEAT repeat protein